MEKAKHPKYEAMIFEAIFAIKQWIKGASAQAIVNKIAELYTISETHNGPITRQILKKMVVKELLIKEGVRYKLTDLGKKTRADLIKPKKPKKVVKKKPVKKPKKAVKKKPAKKPVKKVVKKKAVKKPAKKTVKKATKKPATKKRVTKKVAAAKAKKAKVVAKKRAKE